MTSKLVVIGGGARSGKSAFALRRAKVFGTRRLFVATAQAFDDEMRERIALHIAERGEEFVTIEEPHAIERVFEFATSYDVVVLDCLTLWLSNLLLADLGAARIEERVAEFSRVLAARRTNVVIITNEVGMGIVPETPLGRVFRDVSGRAHQALSAIADELYLGTLGAMLRLRPGPVELVHNQDA